MMNIFKKEVQYNSRNYDVSKPEDAKEFEFILDTLTTFDFITKTVVVEAIGTTKKNIHVNLLSNQTMETWLIRMGFEEAV